jgi:REP element-mobilizing transposase RayT
MSSTGPQRKRVKHYHEPGDIHELTFSCYRRLPLLTNNAWRTGLSRTIDKACEELACHLAAFVFMPEHVHLLVWGLRSKEEVGILLGKIKQPPSRSGASSQPAPDQTDRAGAAGENGLSVLAGRPRL